MSGALTREEEAVHTLRMLLELLPAYYTTSRANASKALDVLEAACSCSCASTVEEQRNEIEKAIWICAIDRLPIEERVEWTRLMRRRYEETSGRDTSAADVDGAEPPAGSQGHHESVGERQGRQPGPEASVAELSEALHGYLVEHGTDALLNRGKRECFCERCSKARAALAASPSGGQEPVTVCGRCGMKEVRPHGGGFKCRVCGCEFSVSAVGAPPGGKE